MVGVVMIYSKQHANLGLLGRVHGADGCLDNNKWTDHQPAGNAE